jgi:hypothetical protein
MEYFKSTSKIRAEVKNNYVYVRNLEEKGGVIDALLSDEAEKKVSSCLQQIQDENFSTVWSILMKIKGVKFDYKSN